MRVARLTTRYLSLFGCGCTVCRLVLVFSCVRSRFFLSSSQPSSDGRLRPARSAALFLIYFFVTAIFRWRAFARALSRVVFFIYFFVMAVFGWRAFAHVLSRVLLLFLSSSQPSLDGRLQPAHSAALFVSFFLPYGRLWMASICSRAQPQCFIYLLLPYSCPQMASFGSRAQPRYSCIYFFVTAILGWRAFAHALSCDVLLLISFSQLSLDGELWLMCSATLFLCLSSLQPSSDGEHLLTCSVTLFCI